MAAAFQAFDNACYEVGSKSGCPMAATHPTASPAISAGTNVEVVSRLMWHATRLDNALP